MPHLITHTHTHTLRNLIVIISGDGLLLWSSSQSFLPQIQRYGFDSRHHQIFREVVGLERDPLRLVSTIEELFGRKSSGSGLDNREYGLYPQKLALTSSTTDGRSVGIVRSLTKATELLLVINAWR
jgi:hypothetical protein